MREPKCPIANMVCPRNSDPGAGKYCPAWTEYVETNQATGDERIQRECMFTAMPKFMIHALAASNRPAAAVESLRNDMVRGLGRIAAAVDTGPKQGQIEHAGGNPADQPDEGEQRAIAQE